MYITLSLELIIGIVKFSILTGIGIYTLLILKNVYQFGKELNNTISKNEENINTALETIPHVLKNVKDISSSTNKAIKQAENTIDSIDASISKTFTSFKDNYEKGNYLFEKISSIKTHIENMLLKKVKQKKNKEKEDEFLY